MSRKNGYQFNNLRFHTAYLHQQALEDCSISPFHINNNKENKKKDSFGMHIISIKAEFNLFTLRFCSPPSTAILSGLRASYSLTSTQATVPKPPMKYMSLQEIEKV